jgi:DNA-directed RNA polymerase specialized sigma24 family protein
VGESYPIFRRALDSWDREMGVDFIGYVSQRLYWGLEHRARRLERPRREAPLTDLATEPAIEATEDRLIAAVTAEALMSRLDPEDGELLRRYGSGYSSAELAYWAGISPQAVRKRLERIRKRLGRASGGPSNRP